MAANCFGAVGQVNTNFVRGSSETIVAKLSNGDEGCVDKSR